MSFNPCLIDERGIICKVRFVKVGEINKEMSIHDKLSDEQDYHNYPMDSAYLKGLLIHKCKLLIDYKSINFILQYLINNKDGKYAKIESSIVVFILIYIRRIYIMMEWDIKSKIGYTSACSKII